MPPAAKKMNEQQPRDVFQEEGDDASESTEEPDQELPSGPVQIPPLEWVAAGVGLLLLLGAVGYQVVEGLTNDGTPPAIAIQQAQVHKVQGGYLVEIEVRNSGGQTAAGLEVEGELEVPRSKPETSTTTFDYVPRGSSSRGGLFFQSNPDKGTLTLRAKGYQEP